MFGHKIANRVFVPGKLTFILDAQAGSSGKGKIGSFIAEHSDNWSFCCNTFMPQAGHWVRLDDGREFFYQTLNSCAYQWAFTNTPSNADFFADRHMYIAPGATIELPAFWREMEENNVNHGRIHISPLTSILQDIDGRFERGVVDFDGQKVPVGDGGYLAKTGTTAHGCGANRARRVLRRPEAKYAKDIPELKEFLCDVPAEIIRRLSKGESGLCEIAQGFQLSYLGKFFPCATSRNCTVAAALDDLMVPPFYAGPVVLNMRTYPIRINSKKYVEKATGKHLTLEEIDQLVEKAGGGVQGRTNVLTQQVNVVEGDSGPGWSDQIETDWETLTKESGSPEPLIEITSVTKLPRRVFTFSRENLHEAIKHNWTGHPIYIALNFINYTDHGLTGQRAVLPDSTALSIKVKQWIYDNVSEKPWSGIAADEYVKKIMFLGTGAKTDDMIVMMDW